jgi:predicted phosphoribosyltransferase
VRKETRAISRCENAYRGDRPAVRVTGRTVILVDDGLAAIETLMTAITAIRASMPARLVVALPVAAGSSYRKLLGLVDDVVCLELPTPFQDVGSCYADFSEVSDLDVRRLHTAASERLQRRPVLN